MVEAAPPFVSNTAEATCTLTKSVQITKLETKETLSRERGKLWESWEAQ